MPDQEYNVLIVDDSFLMRRILANILEIDGRRIEQTWKIF